MRGAQSRYHCKSCNTPFLARVADRERGWAQFCNKSCKQVWQEQAKKIWTALSSTQVLLL